jgi:hypothetical protein
MAVNFAQNAITSRSKRFDKVHKNDYDTGIGYIESGGSANGKNDEINSATQQTAAFESVETD